MQQNTNQKRWPELKECLLIFLSSSRWKFARVIKNKKYSVAETILQKVQRMAEPVPYRKFNRGGGRVIGRAAWVLEGFPIKTSKNILAILKSAFSNADQKGLDTGYSTLKVCSAIAQKGAQDYEIREASGKADLKGLT